MEGLNYDHHALTRYFVPNIELSVVLMRSYMEQLKINYFSFSLTFKNHNVTLFILEITETSNY